MGGWVYRWVDGYVSECIVVYRWVEGGVGI